MSTADEVRRPGAVPLWDLAEWGDRFGVVAGITGRGTGADPFDLGLWTSQPVQAVMTRWWAFLGAVPAPGSAFLSHQVHRTKVGWHAGAEPGLTLLEGLDGHLTGAPGVTLLVTVADCIPVYLVAPRQGVIGLLHAGWRGTAGGILAEAIGQLQVAGISASEVVMHCGVGISGPEYEVGREVMDGVGLPPEGAGPWHLDLRAVLAAQAAALGIGEVTLSGHCSARDAGDFFSHRRSGGTDGRMVAYIRLPRAALP